MKIFLVAVFLLIASVVSAADNPYDNLTLDQLLLIGQMMEEERRYEAQRDAIMLDIINSTPSRMLVCSIVYIGNSATQVCW